MDEHTIKIPQNPVEVNFDGLVGPTHNYAGLSIGNLASQTYAQSVSHPKEAALQGLQKMLLLKNLGLLQGILPPHERPNLSLLRNLGFYGSDIQVLEQAKRKAPEIFYACYSSSSMWAANAATVSPSQDCLDNRLHITPANLLSHFHRFLEADFTSHMLEKIFHDQTKFKVHAALPQHPIFSDEGAANHNRLCSEYGEAGIEIFVYGRSCFSKTDEVPRKYPARQTLEASSAVVRRHQLSEDKVIFVKQNPRAIDEGVFHNDVISVANQNVFLFHEKAFEKEEGFLQAIKGAIKEFVPFPIPMYFLKVMESELSVKEAVDSYLFNSQLITLPDNTMSLIAPTEAQEMARAYGVIDRLLKEDNPIKSVHFVNCRESMKNGGGPACLRLRVVMRPDEVQALPESCFLTDVRYQELVEWVDRYYRETLQPEDLLDPLLLEESRAALDELTKILELGSVYSFQM